MNFLNRLPLVAIGLILSNTGYSSPEPYDNQVAEHCKKLKRHGANQAKSLITLENNSCVDYVHRYDSIAAQYWQPLENIVSSNYESSCFQDGLKEGFVLSTEHTFQDCQNDLSSATKLGYSLGYAACYLMADTVNIRITPLKDESFDRQSFNPDSFVVNPVYSSEWINYIFGNAQVGVLFGCLAGEIDRFHFKAPNIIETTDPDTYSFKLGSVVGSYLEGDICTNFPLETIYENFPKKKREQFIDGLNSTAPNYCGGIK